MRMKKCLLLTLILAIIASSFAGINVSAAWITGENIAPKAKLSAWPSGGDVGEPSSVVDGVIGSGVGGTGARWYAYTNVADAYIEFEFSEAVTIGGAKIVSGQTNTSTSAPDTIESFAIQYYNGKAWVDAAEVMGNTLMTLSVRFPKPATSEKFRIASRQSKNFRIRELELYEATDTGSNMVRLPQLEDTNYRLSFEALANLGVIGELSSFDPEAVVSKEEFISYALKLANHTSFDVKNYKSSYSDVEASKYRNEIVYAELLGYIGKDGKDKFYPKKEITYTEAVQILLSMGGYDFFAQENGGYPTGYMYYANNAGLDNGVEIKKNDFITFGDVGNLLYNAMSMPVYEYTSAGSKTTVTTGLTFLEYFRNIHQVSGILYQTDTFGIPEVSPGGQVKIGNELYNIGEADAKEYVGYSVEAWYVESKGEKTLMYISPDRKNRVYNIEKKDVSSESDFSVLRYYTEDGKEKSINIAYDSYVFLNRELGTAYTDDLYNGSGSLTLIDNDYDGSVEVILISSVRYVVVASVKDNMIYDKLGGAAVDCGDAEELIIIKDGFRCLLRDIKENDIIAVNESGDKKLITMYASDDVVRGTVTRLRDGELKVYIDDKEYRYIEQAAKDLELGMTADFHTDKDGTVVYVDNKLSLGLEYGLMLGFGGDQWQIRTKLMTIGGDIKEYTLADKVSYNDVSTEAKNLLKNDMLFDGDGKFYKQVVKYQLNKEDKVKRLYTAGIFAPDAKNEPALLEENRDSIVRYKDSTQYYYSKPVLAEFNLGRSLVLTPETIVFDGPLEGGDDEEYSVSVGINGLTSGDWTGTVSVYDLAYNNVPNVLFFKRNMSAGKMNAGGQTSVIIEKQEVYDEVSEEVKLAFKMFTAGKEETIVLSNKAKYDASKSTADFVSSFGGDYNATDLTTLDTGDIIQYSARDGEINIIRILAKASDLKKLKANNTDEKIQTTGGSSATFLPSIDTGFGSAYSGDKEVLVLQINNIRYSYNFPAAAYVYIFDTEKNTVTKGTHSDIIYRKNSAGESKIFIRANAKKVQDVMIVE